MTYAQTPNREVIASGQAIVRSLDRIIDGLDDLNEKQLNWRPAAKGANSVYAIASHAIASAEESIQRISGQSSSRDRKQEFSAKADSDSVNSLQQRWQQQRQRLLSAVETLSSAELDREYPGANGERISGRELLLEEAIHAAEHLGQAEITRDLASAN